MLTNYQMWLLISGFLLPPVEAVLQQQHWSNAVRAVVNFILCCLVAMGVIYWKGQFDFHQWSHSVLLVLVTAIATYHGLWQPTNIAPTIESKTRVPVHISFGNPKTPSSISE